MSFRFLTTLTKSPIPRSFASLFKQFPAWGKTQQLFMMQRELQSVQKADESSLIHECIEQLPVDDALEMLAKLQTSLRVSDFPTMVVYFDQIAKKRIQESPTITSEEYSALNQKKYDYWVAFQQSIEIPHHLHQVLIRLAPNHRLPFCLSQLHKMKSYHLTMTLFDQLFGTKKPSEWEDYSIPLVEDTRENRLAFANGILHLLRDLSTVKQLCKKLDPKDIPSFYAKAVSAFTLSDNRSVWPEELDDHSWHRFQ